MKKPLTLALAALAATLVAGCGGVTHIKSLLDDPAHFDKQTVHIAGTVDHAVGLLGYGAYRVNDGTGTLTVVTKAGGAPREGAKVDVEGEFHAAFTLGVQSIAALVEKQRQTQ